jgi:hypothetical protein
MKTEPSPDNLAIPPDLIAATQAEAEAKHRSAGDGLRDVIERGLSDLRRREHAAMEYQCARELGTFEDCDDQPLTDEYRRSLREQIAQGVATARAGRFVDGEILRGFRSIGRPWKHKSCNCNAELIRGAENNA